MIVRKMALMPFAMAPAASQQTAIGRGIDRGGTRGTDGEWLKDDVALALDEDDVALTFFGNQSFFELKEKNHRHLYSLSKKHPKVPVNNPADRMTSLFLQ